MPKKFKGTNTKSEEARARKEAVRIAEKERKQKEEEDKFWEDNDKHVVRKQHRKDEKDRKRQEAAERKAANREALDAEESSLKKDSGVRTKMTMAEIQAVNAREKKADAVAASAAKKNKKEESISEKLEENPNQQMAELMAAEGAVEARSVEEAIAVLGVAEAPVERHPEKRMKAAFSAFEERELPRLKQENPNLRLSQLKQLLKKEWMKSPENPMNMAFSQFNEKKS